MILALDVGSTTVKYLLCDEKEKKILARDYQRHNAHQAEIVLAFLNFLEKEMGFKRGVDKILFTGSGAHLFPSLVGGKVFQEVVAVAKAVEVLFPDVRFVSEIGGEDSKMIFFNPCENSKLKSKQFVMQSVCSGGTGAFIEKLARKLQIELEEFSQMGYVGKSLHKISSKCGIFAELDINTLLKSGVKVEEIVASVFEAVVSQNLLTLTKGNTPLPKVLLLGGPNTFFRGLKEAWVFHLAKIWHERKIDLNGENPEDLILVPEDSLYFGAKGLLFLEGDEREESTIYQGKEKLEYWIKEGQYLEKKKGGGKAFFSSQTEKEMFFREYGQAIKKIEINPKKLKNSRVFLGVDFGSTTAKIIALSDGGEINYTFYFKSKGNPIEDAKEIFRHLKNYLKEEQILGVGVTGYGKDIIKGIIGADLIVPETIAHAQAGLYFFPDADCIVDVGGVDIKIMILRQGAVNDFRLNSQCSSGNGAFLQELAERFQIPLEKIAEKVFQVSSYPQLTMGCGVFLQSDIVNQQRKGWTAEEILAGLCAIIPQNVWIYAGGLTNLSKIGKNIILQGGTHRNLAVVKAQIDFIKSKIPDAKVFLHPYPGEAGAIGVALLLKALYEKNPFKRSFRGFEFIENVVYESVTSSLTTCHWCTRNCQRTFINVKIPESPGRPWSKLPLPAGWDRIITNNSCPKGLVEDINELRVVREELEKKKLKFPNTADFVRLFGFSLKRQ